MTFIQGLQNAAVSLVVAGNEGVAPFLTLFLVGIIEKARPDLLAMGETMERAVASWPGLLFLGVMTVLEFASKCVPVFDEIVDSVMVWVVPFMSVLGTLSTMGLVTSTSTGGSSGSGDDVDSSSTYMYMGDEEGQGRHLSATSSAILSFQVILIILGIALALSMHFLKMIVRMIGVGWLTGILTVVEVLWCVTTVTMAIFVQQIAIALAALMVVGAGYVVKRKWWDKRHGEDEEGGRSGDQQWLQTEGSNVRYYATDSKGTAELPTATPV